MTSSVEAADLVRLARREVADLHAELPRNGLVAWTAGNVSARVRGAGLFVIKPSGVFYDELTPDNMVSATSTATWSRETTPRPPTPPRTPTCTGTCRR